MKYLAYPHDLAYGGPATFQKLLFDELPKNGWSILPPGTLGKADALFVNIGTRNLSLLHQAKRNKIPVIHRLDGVNWNYTFSLQHLKKCLMRQTRNHLVNYIRKNIADTVVYQSNYIKDSWLENFGETKAESHIIHNSTDLNRFHPLNIPDSNDKIRILCVEGVVQVNNEMMALFHKMSAELVQSGIVESISIVGKIPDNQDSAIGRIEGFHLLGSQTRERMPSIYQAHNLFLCLEVNPACPNSVIEALASGLPVCGYDTGSLRELAGEEAGAYGRAIHKGKQSVSLDIDSLISVIRDIKAHLTTMSQKARERALNCFNKDLLIQKYIDLLNTRT